MLFGKDSANFKRYTLFEDLNNENSDADMPGTEKKKNEVI